jgi:hypothetical protein
MTTATAPRHEYVDTREAAGHLGISPNTLACWRSRREGFVVLALYFRRPVLVLHHAAHARADGGRRRRQ